MKCPNCASENRDSARYCRDCGQSLNPVLTAAPDCEAEESTSYFQKALNDAGKSSSTEVVASKLADISTTSGQALRPASPNDKEPDKGVPHSTTVPFSNRRVSKSLPDAITSSLQMGQGQLAPEDGATGAT